VQWFVEMAGIRRTLPVILTVGAGFVGYQYVYRPKQRETLQIYNGITVDQPWRVWFKIHKFIAHLMLAVVDKLMKQCTYKLHFYFSIWFFFVNLL